MKITDIPVEGSDLYSLEALCFEFPNFLTMATLRWWLRDREKNGLDVCCIRIGKRIFISKKRYEMWLSTQIETTKPRVRKIPNERQEDWEDANA